MKPCFLCTIFLHLSSSVGLFCDVSRFRAAAASCATTVLRDSLAGVASGPCGWAQHGCQPQYNPALYLTWKLIEAVVEPHNMRPSYAKFLNDMTGDRLRRVNRHPLEVLGFPAPLCTQNTFHSSTSDMCLGILWSVCLFGADPRPLQ
ncbi:hypothetical protein HPB49_025764 [Dermacentor silvarum]|nr:hypothetical protein HPB49_025764 [Dermacentor silvarum]